MQLTATPTSAIPSPTPAWLERPDLVGTRVEWETSIGRALSTTDVTRLTDGVLAHFDRDEDGTLTEREAVRMQQWTFASDEAGSDEPQFLYSHSTVRQELVSIAALRDAAAGADGIADRAEIASLIGTLELGHGLLFHDLGPTLVKARQVTVPGQLLGASSGHLIVDPWTNPGL